MELTDKMAMVITEVAETEAELWDVFDICNKHQLSSAEESIVIAMYEEVKHQMKSIIDMQREEEKAINEAMRFVSEPIEDITVIKEGNGFKL
ncbi:hypothetical protein H7K20_12605 [Priestia aryabhattai]|uniref:hypothetical protein n=1 Tax=Priestia TaxID=2800373 RepID=UPI001C8D3F70|nr:MULTISPECIES: hypothetical protein [Priestia]MBY0027942.1 hypothetical protein [Priestia aryabhattai]MCU7711125.1 hypothetical protein [Priestia megaterium]MCW1044148.1 hypothetical protein [Priestia sp. JV24]